MKQQHKMNKKWRQKIRLSYFNQRIIIKEISLSVQNRLISKFCLWKAFLSASQNFGAGVVAIPAPPIMVNEAGSLCDCSMEFMTGFRGNWQLGPPKHIAAQFVECIISTLKENDVTKTFGRVVLPTDELVHKSLFNARYLGRKIFLLGNSILRNIESSLR